MALTHVLEANVAVRAQTNRGDERGASDGRGGRGLGGGGRRGEGCAAVSVGVCVDIEVC